MKQYLNEITNFTKGGNLISKFVTFPTDNTVIIFLV